MKLCIALILLNLKVLASDVTFGVDGNNNTVAAWTSFNSSTNNVVVKGGYFASGSSSPTNVQTLSSPSVNSFMPRVSVNSLGQAAVAWTTDDPTIGTRTIEYTFFDATNLWQPTNTLTTSSENVTKIDQIYIMSSGEIVLIWDSIITSSGTPSSRYSIGTYSTFSYGSINSIP